MLFLNGNEIAFRFAGFQFERKLQVGHFCPTAPEIGRDLLAEMNVDFSAVRSAKIVECHSFNLSDRLNFVSERFGHFVLTYILYHENELWLSRRNLAQPNFDSRANKIRISLSQLYYIINCKF